jgi:predicted Rossmann-fold nucleotide-binding protein
MRVLVCGGRDFSDAAAVRRALQAVHDKYLIGLIIEGGALGADRLARQWAIDNGVPYCTYAADWKKHGKAAGPMRNERMIAEGEPDAVVAFPGGRGTADMIGKARAAGLRVWEPIKG